MNSTQKVSCLPAVGRVYGTWYLVQVSTQLTMDHSITTPPLTFAITFGNSYFFYSSGLAAFRYLLPE
jgi:hypothetical protein